MAQQDPGFRFGGGGGSGGGGNRLAGSGGSGNRIINPLATEHAASLEKGDPSTAMTVFQNPGSLVEIVKVVDDMVTDNPWPRHIFQAVIAICLFLWIMSRYSMIRDLMSPPTTRRNRHH